MLKRTRNAAVVTLLSMVAIGASTQMMAVIERNLGALDSVGQAEARIRSSDSQLDMDVKLVTDASYSVGNIPLEIVFTNNTDKPVRLLNAFDTSNAKRVFFTVTLVDSRESPVFTSGGGKISFVKDLMKYVELAKGQQFAVEINLKDFELQSKTPEPGVYSVQVTYRNQYGDNCFIGTLKGELQGLVLVN